jgi:phosphoserine phosphatase RsbU/P
VFVPWWCGSFTEEATSVDCRKPLKEDTNQMPVAHRSSIATKLTLLVLVGTGIVLLIILWFSDRYFRDILLDDARNGAQHLAESVAGRMDRDLRSVAKVTNNLALYLEFGAWPGDKIEELIRGLVEGNKEIYGCTIAFEPYAFKSEVRAYAPYVYKTRNGLKFAQLGADSYDYFIKDWYQIPRELKASRWSPPYFDEGGGDTLMTTYSCPFYEGKAEGKPPKLRAIVTADMTLDRLTEMLSDVHPGQTGFAFLIADDGTFLAHPDAKLLMRESMFSLSEATGDPGLRTIGRQMIREKKGFVDLGASFTGKDSYLAFAHLPTTGWALGVVFPKDDLFAQVNELTKTLIGYALGGVVLLLTVSFWIGQSITRPLRRVAQATRTVAGGNLEIDLVDSKRHDEVGELADAFMRMTLDLKKHIKQLTETTAAKQRIESELSIAATIQRSMLPSRFPAFPNRDDFDIYALMRPAREVGGDLYDFFLLDEDHLCVVVGDVSGKGVPAALFMSVTKYLIEAAASTGCPPHEVLATVNRHLARNNESCMFVTIFLGILNTKTGEFLYANGGHNLPVLADSHGEATFLERPSGPVVGIMDDAEFESARCVLSPGSLLVVYSDGVTEAFNVKDEAFSDERLQATVTRCGRDAPKEVAEAVLKEVDSFVDTAPQADDITIVAVQFKGRRRISS